MTIYEVNERTEPLTSKLLELWERSVRALLVHSAAWLNPRKIGARCS